MTNKRSRLHEGSVFSGFFWGVIVGGLWMLFNGIRVKQLTQDKALSDGIAEGKATAQRRKQQVTRKP